MIFRNTFIYKSIAVCLFTAMLFSCEGNLKEVKEMEKDFLEPQSKVYDLNLFYTDSGSVRANLRSPKMLDYSNRKFPFREFPQGIELDFFEQDSSKNTVYSDYAIQYLETGLIDLRKNVKIVTSDSTILRGPQLYWDQQQEWLFTDYSYSLQLPNGARNEGEGFDSDQKFNTFNSRSNTGIQYIKD
ncbi:LPS export ABC transporter periplasmic protein LptC [Psychroflexus lacisalsi]|jgi:LPS export ABC transporter protein LptC|uniref:LPS export ABC transporter periplasmic protein LptC n=1 Tax=Psychroflexus lacisalsi TaxID=503928 RepID=A0ABN1K2F4_9FLAO|nr:LPS export ABC transporter periplasmic protein LptC [Psychroflexus lacisalsi]MBZ9621077.1 LPS export ABC transporter periplasmic protein LptC [Psychroflexus lacisalsi]